jgi:hypothetical protein
MTLSFKVFSHLLFCVICCVFGIIDHLNAYEYYIYAEFHSSFFKIATMIFILIHPIILFIYNLITLFYLSYISDHDFSELTSDNEYYELIFFRDKMKQNLLWALPLSLLLTFISYFKFFSLYSLKFLMADGNYEVFKNVITSTLYHAVIIQSIFQSLPQVILQVVNNLLIREDKHNMRGVFNFSTLFSIGFMSMIIILYCREDSLQNKRLYESQKLQVKMTRV